MSDQRPQISIIIPAYNEEAVIQATIDDVLRYVSKKHLSYELIVVDDGSTDNTAAIVKSIPQAQYISYGTNRGKGHAIQKGFEKSMGMYVLFMDADNSTNISELNHMLDEARSADIVIGSRSHERSSVEVSQNILKKSLGRIGNLIIHAILGIPFKDTRCGFKLYRKDTTAKYFSQLTMERWTFDDEILFLAYKAGLTIIESPVRWVNNFDSKVSPFDYVRTIRDLIIIKMRYHFGKYTI